MTTDRAEPLVPKIRLPALPRGWAEGWRKRAAWSAYFAAAMLLALLPMILRLPPPPTGIVLEHALYSDGGLPHEVSLPHASFPSPAHLPDIVGYTSQFELKSVPDAGLFLYIPGVNRQLALIVNGTQLNDSEIRTPWSGPVSNTPTLVHLPKPVLRPGRNELSIEMQAGPFMVPRYLSRLYIGTQSEVVDNFNWRVFLDDKLVAMTFGAHCMMGVALILAYFLRRKDPTFSWLLIMAAVTFVTGMGTFIGYQPGLQPMLRVFIATIPASSVSIVAVALSVAGVRPPKALTLLFVLALAWTACVAAIDTAAIRAIGALLGVSTIVGSVAISTAVFAWSGWRGNSDARLMLGPSVVWMAFMAHDLVVTANLPHDGFNLLTVYGRPLYIGGLTAVLMWRMGVSLTRVDRANEILNRTLAAREAELADLYRLERDRTARQVREQERQRLTHDLHDGLSGHLVSIIAMSERAGDGAKPIETAARGALEDLRLVIYSLDLGDRELGVAMANLRERLLPQLQRMGIAVDWSLAGLPEVSGVTPANALGVLRILQEAITNAVKHGPARRIAISAGPAPGSRFSITVENDGRRFAGGGAGRGLVNMRRRAGQLDGTLQVESIETGVRLTLSLPLALPALDDGAEV